jgi:S-formylglutathione hydrolase
VLVMPGTKPRDTGFEGATGGREFGKGAGLYLDATQARWCSRSACSYVTRELPELNATRFPVDASRSGIAGTPWAGSDIVDRLAAFVTVPRRVGFAPIVAPSPVPWGHKALRATRVRIVSLPANWYAEKPGRHDPDRPG